MVTRISKINANIKAYEETRDKIEGLKYDLENWESCLRNYGKNIEYFKNMTDEEFEKRW